MATVTNETELRSAIQSGTDPEILVANDMTVRTYVSVNREVAIRTVPDNPTATLFWAPNSGVTNQYMFVVNAAGHLTADALTMDGEGRNCGLVRLNGGTFTMNDGVTLTGIKSNTANSAVLVGEMTSTVGGTFIMNGGLITGADAGPHTAVFCAGGTVIMRGDAAIDDNPSCGLTAMHNIVDNTRSTVRITENARITNNRSGQSGGGIMLLMSDAVIGESETDAPVISGNYSPYHAGGILALENANLTIGGKTEIFGNSALLTSGGILALTESTLHIGGDVQVRDNKSGTNSGGIGVGTNTTAVIEGNVEIFGNVAGDLSVEGGAGVGNGGGMMLQTGAVLEIKGNVSIHDNVAANGGGLYLLAPPEGSAYAPPSAVIGGDNSTPSIYENTAENFGGGIFIDDGCELTLTGSSSVYDNRAISGRGVYNDGTLKVAESAEVLDGIYFDCTSETPPDPEQPLQCGKAPIIDETLTEDAVLTIELSGHVAPGNVPLVIANGDGDTIPLIDLDRAACRIPPEFGPGYGVMLTPDRTQVIIDAITYTISYDDLYGAEHANPPSYRVTGLPIQFTPPGERAGYTFLRWRDEAGNAVTELAAGTTGDLTLTAVWQALRYSITYRDLFGAANLNPVTYSAADLPISLAAPGERAGYVFVGWRDEAGNAVTRIPADTTGDLAFTAVWQARDYRITYQDLFGAANANPDSYRVNDLPISLAAPGVRPGYAFLGWRDGAGNLVTEIPVGTTGDLTYTATWSEHSLRFDGNAACVSHVPATVRAADGAAQIPCTVPRMPCHVFVGWNESPSGDGAKYCPGDRVDVSNRDVTLYAQWRPVNCP